MIRIIEDDLSGASIQRLLATHLHSMAQISPPESNHTLDLDTLKTPQITLWSAWEEDQLLGCGALKQIGSDHGEIKSMRTHERHTRRGIASAMLEHIIGQARAQGMCRLSLETGSQEEFAPACALYRRYGFETCRPFANYREDPLSTFMTLVL